MFLRAELFFFHLTSVKTFFSIFLFLKKNRMPVLFNSCPVTQNKKKKKESNPFTVRLRRIHFSFESQCRFCELPLRAVVAWRPWAGLYSERQQSSVMACGRFSLNCKNTWGAEAPLCSREGKKKTIIYYSNEMRSGRWWKKGRGLAAENLLLSTSVVSISPWRNKKFKGNQRSWRISLAYFKWATLEAGMGGCIPCKN